MVADDPADIFLTVELVSERLALPAGNGNVLIRRNENIVSETYI
jgi:hypothetical protein